MATLHRKPDAPALRSKEWILPTRTLDEALALMRRYRESDGLRRYVLGRTRLIIAAAAAILLTSIACAMATMFFLADRYWALLGAVLGPLVLIGAAFVQAYVFFRWLEERALTLALGRGVKRWGLNLGEPPPVPWLLAAVFVAVPFAMLAAVSPEIALLLIIVAMATPLAYAYFDR